MKIQFPEFSGVRCLMMPYIQGHPESVPKEFAAYAEILATVVCDKPGDIGYLTIDESIAKAGSPHRGFRAKYGRALHTEAGKLPDGVLNWGGQTVWGGRPNVTLARDTSILLANSIDNTCAVWSDECEDTTSDGDIGHKADLYPMSTAILLKAGEVHRIGILTPHESLPVSSDVRRQFLRIVGKGVQGREPYFTTNPLVSA